MHALLIQAEPVLFNLKVTQKAHINIVIFFLLICNVLRIFFSFLVSLLLFSYEISNIAYVSLTVVLVNFHTSSCYP